MTSSQENLIRIPVKNFGEVVFTQPKILIMDYINKPEIADRDYIIKILSIHLAELQTPSIPIIDWPDDLLLSVAYKWAETAEIKIANNTHISIQGFRQDFNLAISELIDMTMKPVHESFERFHEELTNTLSGITIQPFRIDNPLPIFEAFPRIGEFLEPELEKISEDIENTSQALNEAGYGLLLEPLWLVTFQYIRSVYQLPEPELHEKMKKLTNMPKFIEQCLIPFEETPFLKERLKIIEIAFELHQQENYIAAIPLFLTQIEFLVRRLAILREEIVIEEGKLYVAINGEKKFGRDGKPVKVNGLGQILNNSKMKEDKTIGQISNLIADTLVSERNDILHGRDYEYGTAKLSTRCILFLFSLSHTLYGLDSIFS